MAELRVGIHQPNYVPWLGYFRKVALCDVFVFFDNVQMPGDTSFVSRNSIKTARGPLRLTVPVSDKGEGVRIADARIALRPQWARKHQLSIEQAYARAPWKHLLDEEIAPILHAGHRTIADLNIALIEAVTRMLGLGHVRLVRATSLPLQRDISEALPEILSVTGATHYYTGTGSGSTWQVHAAAIEAAGIETRFMDWSCPEYSQLHGPFVPNLSVVDALLNLGPEATARLIGAGRT